MENTEKITEEVKKEDTIPPIKEKTPASNGESSKVSVWAIIGAVVVVALIVLGLVFLFKQDAQTTGQIRDVFIIFFALESLIIGAALIVLVVQLAVLINLLQNEIKPIIDSTNETVHTIKGTAVFLSDNMVQPVIKLNEYLAGLKKVADLFNPKKQ
jgi:amino acid permease